MHIIMMEGYSLCCLEYDIYVTAFKQRESAQQCEIL